MFDSGINRLGLGPEQLTAAAVQGVEVDLLLSHLASADADVAQNSAQLSSFQSLVTTVNPKRRSFANSAGIMLGDDYHFDLTRPGLSLYGDRAPGNGGLHQTRGCAFRKAASGARCSSGYAYRL